jgi:large subunit ribosomal protein L15
MTPLNLDTLAEALQSGRLVAPADRALNMKDLQQSGVVHTIRDGVKLLGRGAASFAASGLTGVSLEVSRTSESARTALQATGGHVTTVHYNRLGLRALLKPHRFPVQADKTPLLPAPARPPPRLRHRVEAVGGLPAGSPTLPIPPLLERRGTGQ